MSIIKQCIHARHGQPGNSAVELTIDERDSSFNQKKRLRLCPLCAGYMIAMLHQLEWAGPEHDHAYPKVSSATRDENSMDSDAGIPPQHKPSSGT
jgi:hypothetical protein